MSDAEPMLAYVAPLSAILAQHYASSGSVYRVFRVKLNPLAVKFEILSV